ncbi:hypothetical protein K9U39_10910 [Rhodoblastus acidophilus]|uniref:Phage protein Gp138 N-terminal domain-containing protein n=1 Tax=Candidatus Rhodoblastus alkanivorans TaxID=2954117 RepID=A0ABS9ZAP2_9HYPH|nr:hypothetical protein [Candidatus Rhodoblastus alkanivorans]MCI4680164.1 hypothetical protein [Candidatus Rhodoblastus alkanivorans]MCI4684121.1 hypothetical protein [Candidatus Rhodoblastus alkanivorans]MDI4641441.1 hypothetical protein [Rhodoblastus acidophilus]
MSNISLLSLQQVVASVEGDEDFAPPPLQFFEADGVTPIDLTGIEFTARVGMLPPLTSASGGGIAVSGNSLTFFMPAAAKIWPTGRFPFMLLASDGAYTRDLFAHSTLTVGQPASFSVTSCSPAGPANALSSLSGAALLALIANMPASVQQSLFSILADAQAAYVPNLDCSHVVNSQYIGSTPFLFTLG